MWTLFSCVYGKAILITELQLLLLVLLLWLQHISIIPAGWKRLPGYCDIFVQ